MRKTLDKLYVGSGVIASLLIAAICVLVCTQVVFNLITRLGGGSINLTIPSYGEFAGYFLAASSFLALAYTLTNGGHIRVNLLLTRLPPRVQLAAEVISLAVCALMSIYVSYYMAKLCLESHEFGDLSPGIVPVSLWIPQSVVLLGLIILSIALVDLLLRTISTRKSVFEEHEDSELRRK